MSNLLDLHLSQTPDPTIVPGGEEYQLHVQTAELGQNKDQTRDMITVMLTVVGNPTALPVFEYLAIPNPDDAPNTQYLMKLRIKQFLQAFDVDVDNPGEPGDWVGKEGWAVLKVDEYEGVTRNKVSRYIVKK